MKKSFSQLKKDLKVGTKLKVLYHCRQNDINGERFLQDRVISKVQTNAFTSKWGEDPKDYWCYYPTNSNLVDYEENTFTFYEYGERELTDYEKTMLDKLHNLCTKEERYLDAYTDSNIEYWRQKKYARENNVEYLLGFEFHNGLKYNFNTGKMYDKKIKGNKLFIFQIVNESEA